MASTKRGSKRQKGEEFVDGMAQLAESVNKKFKMEVVVSGDGKVLSDVNTYVPTSSLMLNRVLGGGVPVGRIIEIFGDNSAGKSTLVEHMMIGFQRFPGISILIDSESAWDRSRAMRMGHNSDRHLSFQCDTVELAVSVTTATIEKIRDPESKFPPEMPVGIFWDTISASQTEGEKTGDIYKEGMADKTRKVRAALRKFSFLLPKTNCSLIFVSQTIADMRSRIPGRKKSASAGDAIKFWSSKRFKVAYTGKFNYPHKNAGIICAVQSIKDKLTTPFQRVDLPLMFDTGIHNGYELLMFILENTEHASISGGRVKLYDFPEEGEKLTFYMKQLPDMMVKHPLLVDYMKMIVESTLLAADAESDEEEEEES